MAKPLADFSAEIDHLYQLPLSDFIAGRNALAARVRGEQGAEAAAAIKALTKPSIPAWIVNQLYWRDRKEFERLIKAGDHLRAAQQHRLAGHGDPDDLRHAVAARQETINALIPRAREIMRSGGLTLTADMQQRVAMTIESLSAYGTSEAAPRAGRLVEEVKPPGLDALASLIPASGNILGGGGFAAALAASAAGAAGAGAGAGAGKAAKGARADLRVVETKRPDKAALAKAAEAKAALDAAEQAVDTARTAAKDATAAQEKAEADWTAAHQALQDARRALDSAMDSERDSQRHRDAARREATQATHALDRAERARDAAERQLAHLQP
jgi:hypothetical protein